MTFRRRNGFTLIELMIAVCIIGVLASVALPTYQTFVMRARGAEGLEDIASLYRGAVSYWERGVTTQGITASKASHCLVNESGGMMNLHPPYPFLPYKRTYDWGADPSTAAMSFSKSAPSYFHVSWMTRGNTIPDPGGMGAASQCGSSSGPAYAFISMADIDGDGMVGGYSQLVFIEEDSLRRQGGIGNLPTLLNTVGIPCPFCAPDVD